MQFHVTALPRRGQSREQGIVECGQKKQFCMGLHEHGFLSVSLHCFAEFMPAVCAVDCTKIT